MLRVKKIVLLSLCCSLLCACTAFPSAQPTVTPPSSAQALDPTALPSSEVPANTLRWSVDGLSDLSTLDPIHSNDVPNNMVLQLIYAGLVRFNNRLEIQPDGASEWHVSNDGLTYTFIIRENLRFADGKAVRAQDFVDSLNRALDPAQGAIASSGSFGHIVGASEVLSGQAKEASGLKALDDRTLQITLDSPIAYFLSLLAYANAVVLPPALLQQEQWPDQAYGTGPYRVKEWRRGEAIILEANPYYWQGEPGIAQIEMPFHHDIDQALEDYRAGNLDIMGNVQNPVPLSEIDSLRELPDFRSSAALVTRYIGFNHQLEPFNQVDVRRAFALALDKKALIQQLMPNGALPAQRILPSGLLGTQLPIMPLEFNRPAAQAALARAGFADGKDFPVVTLSYGLEGNNQQVAQALQNMWQENLGVQVELEGLDLSQFSRRLDQTYREPQLGVQLYYSVWGADYPDPHNFLSLQLRTDQPNNNGHFSNSQFDNLTLQADKLGELSQVEERLLLYNQAEQIAVDQVAWLPMFYPQFSVLINPRVSGFQITPQALVVEDWSKVKLN